jgi:hypothetical protein
MLTGSQDDAFFEGTEKYLVRCKNREKIEKVTGSQQSSSGGDVSEDSPQEVDGSVN